MLFLGHFHYTPPTVQASGTPSPMLSLTSSPFQMRKAQMSPSCPPVCGLLQRGGTLSGLSRLRSKLSPLSDRMFVPDTTSSQVLQWGHSSKSACHPGFQRTLFLIRQRFWWSTSYPYNKEFVSACSICAHSKTPHHAPAELLQPLPVPHRP